MINEYWNYYMDSLDFNTKPMKYENGEKPMNIYEKLQQARIQLQSKSLKKSGKNKFANYDYFELGDFLPEINQLFHDHKLFSHVYFEKDMAYLNVVNAEKPDEFIQFTSPMVESDLKGCLPIQSLGAIETYQRRYLYLMALEIVEHDAIDPVTGKDEPKQDKQPVISEAQLKRLYAIANSHKISKEDVEKVCKKDYQKDPKDLTKLEYDALCTRLEKKVE